jgi:hypothetical protein
MEVEGKLYKVWSKDDGDALITTKNVDELIHCIETYEKKMN